VTSTDFIVRAYAATDEEATLALWQRSWQAAYPQIDFDERLDWWRDRWHNDTAVSSSVFVAERDGAVIGFVTINPASGYLDQLVVAPECWGAGIAEALMREAFRLSPRGIDLHVNQDNARALRFYQKQGFKIVSESVNPRSGLPVYLLRWAPQ
jgi:putative acetyltransferase